MRDHSDAETLATAAAWRQVHYITAPQPLAAGLVKYGDFLAPPQGAMRYGYGCLLYSQYCDFSTQGALSRSPNAADGCLSCPVPACAWLVTVMPACPGTSVPLAVC